MLTIGQMNTLDLVQIGDHYCGLDGGAQGEISLLDPPDGVALGDRLTVFLYVDGEANLVATCKKPALVAGEVAPLRVVAVTEHGAYLDWGLPSDLFLPRSKQIYKPGLGDTQVVYALVDPDNQRMLGSAKLHHHLQEVSDGGFSEGDAVALLIYQETELGFKAVINQQFIGVLFRGDLLVQPVVGQSLEGYIKAIRPDGKIDLRLSKDLKTTRSDLQSKILQHLAQNGGTSNLTDKSAPEAIYQRYRASKNAYKQALGGLYKQKLIAISPGEITLLDAS